ncbi:hypothetical protein AV521_18365 [Streptomyces sp. IMTB 2501]|uniref:hypothetical protein n=1 Tax=Streptomyces sp. IMTB 2501 TaxID=1776340 RepID=UPI00096EFF44|nr:hypothetical protein [Streptomyces sp. IMTB 2501]OLZ69480.1 hypothetical protein AV521_18365 [Streptomyces sp. IMTB 2501]
MSFIRYLPPWYEMSGAQASVAYDAHQPGLTVKASDPAVKAIRSVDVPGLGYADAPLGARASRSAAGTSQQPSQQLACLTGELCESAARPHVTYAGV